MFSDAARASRGSLATVSRSFWVSVFEWIVVRNPFSMPNSSLSTFATGASPFVVHDALLMIVCLSGSKVPSFTPSTIVLSSFFAGAEMITLRAPASMCARALVASVKKPVDSMTMSMSSAFQGSSAGLRSASTFSVRPSMTIESAVAETSPLYAP